LNRAYNSLEWCLTSPPRPHPFVSLPLQSGLITIKPNFLSGFTDAEGCFMVSIKQAGFAQKEI